MKKFLTLLLALFLTACGAEFSPDEMSSKEKQISNEQFQPDQTDEEKEIERELERLKAEAMMNEPKDESFFYVTGYLSPYEVEVDGKTYTDTEDFYTVYYTVLEKEKDASGYKDWKLDLNANIGVKELKKNMIVSLVPNSDVGYTAEENLDWDGKFKAKLPIEAEGDTYTIRAYKKIDVSLNRFHENDYWVYETVKWCFNFIATRTINANEISKPYIIKSFKTKITKYKCARFNETLGTLTFQHKTIQEETKAFIDGLENTD